ncbi:MAG: glycoside hydrolase family protein, partial [Methylocella sp.]
VDGSFGSVTEKAVVAFQKAKGLKPDAVVGAKTWAALGPYPPPTGNVEAPVASPKSEVPITFPVSGLHISKQGLNLIKHFEGCPTDKLTGLAVPYDDNGSPAICFGHSNRSQKPPIVTADLRLTMAECDAILARDLLDYENRVKTMISVPLKQHQFDALVSIAYNWGPGNLDRSNLKTLVNAGKHKEAEAAIRTILPPEDKKYYAGILRRRNKEADLYGA